MVRLFCFSRNGKTMVVTLPMGVQQPRQLIVKAPNGKILRIVKQPRVGPPMFAPKKKKS